MATDTSTIVSREEYLAAERSAPRMRSEWIDGEVREMTGATHAHNVLCVNLVTLLAGALRGRDFFAYANDMKVRIPKGPYYYPDVVVVPDPPAFEDDRRDIVFNPLVVVEVLSPSTEEVDRSEKLDAYRSIPSVTDYLLMAQDTCRVDQHTRGENDRWGLTIHRELVDVVRLPSLGCEVPLRDVYERVVSVPE